MLKGLMGIVLFFLSIYVFANVRSPSIDGPETRVKIVIIDTGLNVNAINRPFVCKNSSISLIDDNPFLDTHGHGTSVSSLVIQNLDVKKNCIVMVKFWSKETPTADFLKNVVKGVHHAIKIDAKFINMSLGGSEYDAGEHDAIALAISKGIKIAVASGNNSGKGIEKDARGNYVIKTNVRGQKILKRNLFGKPICKTVKGKIFCQHEMEERPMAQNLDGGCIYFPACYEFPDEYFHVVGSSTGELNEWGGTHFYGNYGSKVKYQEDGTEQGNPKLTGTSMSTAIHTGKWASGKL